MSELYHYGRPNQKWGIRNYQNRDGTWTELGKARRRIGDGRHKILNEESDVEEPKVRLTVKGMHWTRPVISAKDPKILDAVKKRGNLTDKEAKRCIDIANGKFLDLKANEPYVTDDVSKSIGKSSTLYGLEHRLKTPVSIAAKIGADAKADNISFKEAASSMGDGIRYTVMTPTEDFVQAYKTFNDNMAKQGYIEMKCKNNFVGYAEGKVMHKSVQSQYSHAEAPSLKFEVQFQTPESQNAKDLKVPIYEERRKAGNTEERNQELEQQMRGLADAVKDPSGVSEIKSFNRYKMTHSSLEGGSMYVKGTTLVLSNSGASKSNELYHYGVPRMKHGIRNYQNRDGTWTELGKKRRRIGGGQRQQAKISKWVDDAGDSVTDAVKTGAKKVVGDLRNFARGTGKDTADAIKLGAKTVHDDAAKAFPNATATVDQTAANAKESVKETAGQMRLKETAKNTLDSLKSVPDQIDDATSRVRYKDIGNKFKKVFDSAYSPDTSDEDFKRIIKVLDSDPEIESALAPIKKEAIRIQDTMYRKYSDDFNSKEARQEYNDMMKNLQNQIRETGKKLGLDAEDPEYEDFYENHVGDRICDWTGNFGMACYIYHSDSTPDTAAIIHSGTLILGDPSSYLTHSGVKGMKWYQRLYQNYDGSLTPLGYIHYGYGKAKKAAGGVAKATAKGVTGTAKTLHKIGKHTAVSIKNASDKHKAKALAKKKAKASQSREGVLKNKKLFTTDELRTLGERFDQEDKLKLKESAESMFDYDSKRLAKKKEKAAQSREGVLKNKELFTTEELRALSQRFDVEDDISLGKVRKGAEIVGKVAENAEKVAKAVKAGGEAYNVLTGKAPLKDKGKDKDKDKDKDKNKDDSDKKDDKGGNKDNGKSNMVDEAESRKMFTEDDYGRTIDYNPRPASRSSSGSVDATRSSTRRDDSPSWASSPDSSHGPSPDFSEPTSSRNTSNTSNTSNSSYRPRASAEDLARGEAMIRNDIRNAMARASETHSSGSNSAYDEHLNQVLSLLEAQKRGEVPIEYHSYAIDNDPMFQTQDPTYTYRRKKVTHSAIEGTTLILGDTSPYLAHYGRKGMKWYQHIFAKAVGNRDSRGRLTEKGKRKLAKKITKKKSKKKIYEGAREAIESKKRLHKNVHTAVGATSGAIIAGSISAVLGASAVVAAPAVAGGALIVGGIGRGLSALESNTSSASYKRKIKKVDKQIDKLEKKLADG